MKLVRLFPYEYARSVFAIDYEKLRQLGFTAIIFDIDNTLVHHGEDSTPQVDALFDRLHALGFSTLLLTDNDEERTLRFLKNIDSLYLCEAGKPAPEGYLKALQMLGTGRNETVVIGDQMFKDILGAGNSSLPSILVHYIRQEGERWPGFRRILEKVLLLVWRFTKYYQRLGGIQRSTPRPEA